MNKIVKVVLAMLFFICLLKMPYGYFQLIRVIALIGFGVLAYQSYQLDRKAEMIIFIGLALLFQPIFKIPLGRQIWNIVDIVVGIGLIISAFIKNKEQ